MNASVSHIQFTRADMDADNARIQFTRGRIQAHHVRNDVNMENNLADAARSFADDVDKT